MILETIKTSALYLYQSDLSSSACCSTESDVAIANPCGTLLCAACSLLYMAKQPRVRHNNIRGKEVINEYRSESYSNLKTCSYMHVCGNIAVIELRTGPLLHEYQEPG